MQPAAPQPASGIHIVLRGLTLVMYSGANGIELREERVPDRECDQGYMQSRFQVQIGRHLKRKPFAPCGNHLHIEDDAMTDGVSLQTSKDYRDSTHRCGGSLRCCILACEHMMHAYT